MPPKPRTAVRKRPRKEVGESSTQGNSSRGNHPPPPPPYDPTIFCSLESKEKYNRLQFFSMPTERYIKWFPALERYGALKGLFEFQKWIDFLGDPNKLIDMNIMRLFYANLYGGEDGELYSYLFGTHIKLDSTFIEELYEPNLPSGGLVITRRGIDWTNPNMWKDHTADTVALVTHGHPRLGELRDIKTFHPRIRLIEKILRHSIFPKEGEKEVIRDWYRCMAYNLIVLNPIDLPAILIHEIGSAPRSGSTKCLRFGRLVMRICEKLRIPTNPTEELVRVLPSVAFRDLPAPEDFVPVISEADWREIQPEGSAPLTGVLVIKDGRTRPVEELNEEEAHPPPADGGHGGHGGAGMDPAYLALLEQQNAILRELREGQIAQGERIIRIDDTVSDLRMQVRALTDRFGSSSLGPSPMVFQPPLQRPYYPPPPQYYPPSGPYYRSPPPPPGST